MSQKIRLRVKGTIPGYAPGRVVSVEVDEHGTPLEEQWRRRLKDAKIDGCVEVVAPDNTANLPPDFVERLEKLPKAKSGKKKASRRSDKS